MLEVTGCKACAQALASSAEFLPKQTCKTWRSYCHDCHVFCYYYGTRDACPLFSPLQKILQEFVNIEMVYHAKALEMYTQCFQNLNSISEEEDLEVNGQHDFKNRKHHLLLFNCIERRAHLLVAVDQIEFQIKFEHCSNCKKRTN